MILSKKMKNTHLSKLLLTLTTKELKLLKKWVASPFFNQRTDVIQLLDLFLKYRKKDQDIPSKQEIFNHLYPNEAYEDHKVRMVISFLNRQTEQFLIYQEQQRGGVADKIILLKVYRKRVLEKPYKRVTREIEKTFDQTVQKNKAYYQLKYQYYQEQYKTEALVNRYERKHSIQAITDNLDIYIFLEKIREGISAVTHGQIAFIQYDLGIFEDLLTSLQEKPSLLENPAIATYYAAYLAILQPKDDVHFKAYQQLLENNQSIFDKEELSELYDIAYIYLLKRYIQGESEYLPDLFANYQKIIQLNLYEDKITQYHFKNIIDVGLKNGAYDWIEQFIVDYAPKLDKVHQNTLPRWAQASLARRRGQYQKALQLLTAIKVEDVNHSLTVRLTMTKIYFEINDWDALQKHLKAFEIYIRRLNKIEAHKKYYLDFILFAQKMSRINQHDKTEKAQLLETLKSSDMKFERKWLITYLTNL